MTSAKAIARCWPHTEALEVSVWDGPLRILGERSGETRRNQTGCSQLIPKTTNQKGSALFPGTDRVLQEVHQRFRF